MPESPVSPVSPGPLGLAAEKIASAGMPWSSRWCQLLARIERIPDAASQAALIQRLVQPLRPTVLAFVNAHAMNSVVESPVFFDSLMAADVLLRDGSGMSALYQLLGMAAGQNLNGTDLIPRLIPHFNGRPVALFGTQEPYLERAAEVLRKQLLPDSPLLTAHGFLPTADYVARAQASPCALIVLGMGMPRQEAVALALRQALTQPCLVVCGGAIIDFLGGKTPRAPAWMRRMGLEWLYRLAQEPRRLFQRYVVGNPVFLVRAVRLRLRLKRQAQEE
jgi:N-acetylglucosaminyldiphosphoundecaprenol N-acetyl-beta-D-mannosaminyltransferase